jgi:hypothetical protein
VHKNEVNSLAFADSSEGLEILPWWDTAHLANIQKIGSTRSLVWTGKMPETFAEACEPVKYPPSI